jgi:hypothetical protein
MMPCTDPDLHFWNLVPNGSHYNLSVTGPAGFGAFATFDEAGPPGAVQWSKSEISPGPKTQLLGVPSGTHVIRIFVDIAVAGPITVKVEAKIPGVARDFCREITGTNGKRDIITHIIKMA